MPTPIHCIERAMYVNPLEPLDIDQILNSDDLDHAPNTLFSPDSITAEMKQYIDKEMEPDEQTLLCDLFHSKGISAHADD